MHHYRQPKEIKTYGKKINLWDQATKSLADFLISYGYSREQIYPLIGHSPMNPLNATGFVVHGPGQYRDALRQPHAGLFGIFFLLHLPEMQMAKRMPGLLGQRHGFRLQLEHEGKIYEAPLNDAKLGCKLHVPHLTLAEPLQLTASDGSHYVAPADTVISKDAVHKDDYRNPKPDCLQRPSCLIDGQGRPVSRDAAAKILWGSLGARGMKALEDMHRIPLQRFGTDDDFTAEKYMVEALDELADAHGVDLMPEFNRLVRRAHAQLLANEDYRTVIACIAELPYTIAAGQLLQGHGERVWFSNIDQNFSNALKYFAFPESVHTASIIPKNAAQEKTLQFWKELNDDTFGDPQDRACVEAIKRFARHFYDPRAFGTKGKKTELLARGHWVDGKINLVRRLVEIAEQAWAPIEKVPFARSLIDLRDQLETFNPNVPQRDLSAQEERVVERYRFATQRAVTEYYKKERKPKRARQEATAATPTLLEVPVNVIDTSRLQQGRLRLLSGVSARGIV